MRSSPTEPFVEVSAAVIERDDRILACQRRYDGPHPGKWEFPGGKREGAETFEACLRRELREELEIEAKIGAALWSTSHRYPGRPPVHIIFFYVSQYRGHLINRVFSSIAWVHKADLYKLDFLAADRDFVALLGEGKIVCPPQLHSGP